MTERRKAERFELSLQASVSAIGQELTTSPVSLTTKDVSMNGAYFTTPEPLPVGTRVDVDMLLKLEDDNAAGVRKAWVKASGSVYRVDRHGMVIRFDEASKILPFSAQLLSSELKPHGE